MDITSHWTERHEVAFKALKTALARVPVLQYANFERPFNLETDASHDGLSAILSQDQPDGTVRVVAYRSRRLRPAEKKSSCNFSFKLEMLAFK